VHFSALTHCPRFRGYNPDYHVSPAALGNGPGHPVYRACAFLFLYQRCIALRRTLHPLQCRPIVKIDDKPRLHGNISCALLPSCDRRGVTISLSATTSPERNLPAIIAESRPDVKKAILGVSYVGFTSKKDVAEDRCLRNPFRWSQERSGGGPTSRLHENPT